MASRWREEWLSAAGRASSRRIRATSSAGISRMRPGVASSKPTISASAPEIQSSFGSPDRFLKPSTATVGRPAAGTIARTRVFGGGEGRCTRARAERAARRGMAAIAARREAGRFAGASWITTGRVDSSGGFAGTGVAGGSTASAVASTISRSGAMNL
jgi:hypothetical protein